MKRKFKGFLLGMLILSIGFTSSGCVLFLLGAGATGGYAISKDEIEGMLDKSYNDVWKASEQVLRKDGLVMLSLKDKGEIDGEVEGSKIEIRLEQVTPKTVRLRVKGRKLKNLFPDIKKAQNTFNKIMKELA